MTFYLPQKYVNTPNLLSFHVVDRDGFLKDPHFIGFRIFDESGVQVFPATLGNFEDVTLTGKVTKGRFYAFDASSGEGWAIPAAAVNGSWRIQWKWQENASDAFGFFNERFDVVDSYDSGANTGFRGSSFRTYISPLRVREEGLEILDCSDSRIEELILDSQAYVERETRNIFRPVYDSVRFSGNNTGKLFLSLPIVGVETLNLNDSTADLNHSSVAIAFARIDKSDQFTSKPDYRRMPSIALKTSPDIWGRNGFLDGGKFASGRLNQTVTGIFGFLESDGTVPRLIQFAMLKLVYATAYVLDVDAPQQVAGPLKSRVVDRHSESFESSASGDLKRALAKSKDVEEALMLYKAPIALGAPSAPIKGSRLRL
jgi:hypothetical protein